MKRKRLFEKLDRYEEYNLIMVTAPAGYGKTALISSWLKEKNYKKTWLTLDEEDNEEELFWSYFLLSFYKNSWIPKEIRERANAMFRNTVPFNKLSLTYFINDVESLGMQVIMVLDDFGVIKNEKILYELKFLIKYLPSNMHLVFTGRSYSDVGFAKLKSMGNVLVLVKEDICLTQEETVSFFQSVVHVNLAYEQYAKVHHYFEGWAAGMQMVALSVNEDKELKFPVPVKHHLISSYLMEEVIYGLHNDIKKFLMETAVFEQFCPELCDFLFHIKSSRKIIQELEHLNLFLVCIDRQEEWFRYHSLFREFLINMYCEKDDNMQFLLFRRAAEWYESKKSWKEAITYAIKGENFGKAVVLIEDFGIEIGCKGESGLLHKWNQQLPETIVKNNPRLLLNSAWAYSAEGKMQEMLQCVEELENTKTLPALLRAEVTALTSSNLSGSALGLEKMMAECKQALQILSVTTFLSQLICFNMGVIFLWKGCVEESLHYFEQCYRLSKEAGEIYLTIISGKAMITSRIRHGQLQKAEQEIRELLKTSVHLGGDILPAMGLLYAELAEIYYQKNELEEALKVAVEGSKIAELGEDVWSAEENYLVLEKIYQAMNDQKGYKRIKKKASLCLEGRNLFDISLKLECYHTQILMNEGKLTLVSKQISNLENLIGSKRMLIYPEYTFLKVRFYRNKGKLEKAIEILTPLRVITQSSGQNGLLCEVLVLFSTIYEKMGNSSYALKELENAIALGKEQNNIRIFLDEGNLMKGMLKRLIEKKKAERMENAFADILMDYFQMQTTLNEKKREELLSTREIEILKLITQGANNVEIAGKLFISANTVKTHLLHIYSKLGVHNRQKAALKAVTLNIIS